MMTTKLDDLLQERFGFSAFRPGQREVIEALLGRGRALAVFPTGGGKSICYQLTALMIEGVTLVVSPLIALMKDQIDFLRGRGIAAGRLDSTLGSDETTDLMQQLERGTLKLLYVAPERFNNERFLELLKRTQIGLFAIDEAHCISEWGHNFRPDYLKLAETAQRLKVARVLTLTATATPSVVADIRAAFDISLEDAVVTGFYRPNLKLALTPATAESRDGLLLKRFAARPAGPTIVYVTLQKTAESVAKTLSDAGYPAEAYHAGMESEARDAVQDRWMASDRGVVVATIAFGMGIDKANVRYVYHYNLPKSLESYSQEIGRAGRDGETSVVEMFACRDDVASIESFAYGDTPTAESIEGVVREMVAAPEIEISQTTLASRHDMRPLVLRTALTYLELAGVLRQKTPTYAAYKVKLTKARGDVLAAFDADQRTVLSKVFDQAKAGRIWLTIDPAVTSQALKIDRLNIVRAIDLLEERGLAEVSPTDLRHRYERMEVKDVGELVRDLTARFERRETQEVTRMKQVIDLVESPTCHTNMLAAHFGEVRAQPCGHCVLCLTKRVGKLAASAERAALPGNLDVLHVRQLRENHPDALGQPRQLARWLTGLSSPATTRAKLTKHALFGELASYPFRDVLEWCSHANA